MTGDVNSTGALPSLRQAQVAHTEQRILAAATELFLEGGYLATTLEAVARRAQVGARTVYLRFGTKAALFKRVVDVAIVGDTQPVDVLGRDWTQAAGRPGIRSDTAWNSRRQCGDARDRSWRFCGSGSPGRPAAKLER